MLSFCSNKGFSVKGIQEKVKMRVEIVDDTISVLNCVKLTHCECKHPQ